LQHITRSGIKQPPGRSLQYRSGAYMKDESSKRLPWSKPVVKRLGTIKDVAGAETAKAQGVGNKKS